MSVLTVKTFGGDKIKANFQQSESIRSILQRIAERLGSQPTTIHLTYSGKVITQNNNLDKTAADCHLEDGSTIIVVARLIGGVISGIRRGFYLKEKYRQQIGF